MDVRQFLIDYRLQIEAYYEGIDTIKDKDASFEAKKLAREFMEAMSCSEFVKKKIEFVEE